MYQGKTPLMFACEIQNLSVIELLIEHGADLNIISDIDPPLTPLIISTKKVAFILIQLEEYCNHEETTLTWCNGNVWEFACEVFSILSCT